MFSHRILLCSLRRSVLIIRNKHKSTHWSVQRKKVHPIHKALDHFDDFYKQVFREKWLTIRQGLLSKQKYVAVINNYSDSEETIANLENIGALNMRTLFHLEKGYISEKYEKNKRIHYLEKIWKMENQMNDSNKQEIASEVNAEDKLERDYSLEASIRNADLDITRLVDENSGLAAPVLSQFLPATKIKGKDDWIPESQHYRYYEKESSLGDNIEKEYDIHFPEHLNVYCFEQNNYSNFESPKRGITGVYNYYLMDGGSVLPVLALDLKPGHTVLDMCAAPGGKTLIALQTLYPEYIVCNDSSTSRVHRIFNVLEQYFYDLDERWIKANRLKVTHCDGRAIEEDNFDRILVDVPCTTDRHSVIENENNIFRAGRTKERLKLPELQCALLFHALKLVRKGGIVVYSTCSLSPIQNDGVVYMALKQIWEETKIEVVVKDLSPALAQIQSVYKLADQNLMKYGHLIVPFVPQNYGPTYFCKLQRVK